VSGRPVTEGGGDQGQNGSVPPEGGCRVTGTHGYGMVQMEADAGSVAGVA